MYDDIINVSEYKSSDRVKSSNIINNEDLKEKNKKFLYKSELVLPRKKNPYQNSDFLEKKSNDTKANLTFDKPVINIKEDLVPSNSKESSSNINIKNKRVLLPILDPNIMRSLLSFGMSSEQSEKESKESKEMNENCLICEEKLTDEEKTNNYVKCFHGFCNDCYYNYFKEKINNNQIYRIKCPEKNCNCLIFNEFIEKKLINDIPLIEKFHKLSDRIQLALDPNIQLCPFPDCESYAKKNENNKYVSCIQNSHKFCFKCLKDWHGDKECSNELDKSFVEWKDSSKVKRCPKCKYFIEKNEGCNHITCTYCKYEFCWLCMNEYKSGHYDLNGSCFGLQYSKADCFSNKLCICLYNNTIFILKLIAFAILIPFALSIYILYKISDKYNDFEGICFVELLSVLMAIFIAISISGLALSISSFISILMIFIKPLREFIFEKLNNF